MTFFSHQHPQLNGDIYQLVFAFPTSGRYLLYADYKPAAHTARVEQLEVKVEGNETAGAPEFAERLRAQLDTLTVELNKENLHAIKALVYENGDLLPACAIDDFLGAKAHVVMIHTESKEFLHVHPMVHNESLVLHAGFRSKGRYRVWVQFLLRGKLYTSDFVLQADAVPHSTMAMHHRH